MQTSTDFGKIEYVISSRAERIRVRILVDGLKVTLPKYATQEQALQFIRDHHEKILSKQEKIKKTKNHNTTFLSENTELKTLTFTVILRRIERKDIYFSLKSGVLTIEFPHQMDITTKISQEHCWNGINYFLRKEAKRLLPERTSHLAAKFGFNFTDIKIQSSKSRWGSCSQQKSINLSFYLMLVPAHLIEYVILHELCHTREMNHGDKFWKLMDKVTDGKSKLLRQELKKYNMPN
jgi:predicted metal-dependent hydrolase